MRKDFMENENKIFDVQFEVKKEDVKADGTFKGYASTFGGDPDSYGDIIAPKAFKESLAKNGYGGNGIKMLWQHDPHSPIGVWVALREDSKGLYVEGKLTMGVQQAQEAHALLQDGALNTMSIGFRISKFSWDEETDIRTLEEIELYEISLVTFPANTSATITAVKTAINDVMDATKDARELESLLREAKGMSRESAKYLVSLIKAGLKKERDVPEIDLSCIVSELKRTQEKIRRSCGTPKMNN